MITETHKLGDIIFVKKEENRWTLKQYPKVNGGIIVIDPFTGDIKALVGGSIFVKVNLIELHKLKGNPVQLLNQSFTQLH